MVAEPNGSGKSTLAAWLAQDYAVNFYTMLNADEVFAEVSRTGACFVPFPVDASSLLAYVEKSQYGEGEKTFFRSGAIAVDFDCVRFHAAGAVNSYTVAMHLSRAYFFDNLGDEMRYLASYSEDDGFELLSSESIMPRWFRAIFKGA